MQGIIEIIVSPTGETTVQTKGVKGRSCKDFSKAIEEALGARTSESLTSDYYADPARLEIKEG
jgi:hypothetical protein